MVIFNALQTSLSGGIGRYSYELAKSIYTIKKFPIKIVIREEDKDVFDFAKDEDLIVIKNIKNSKDRNYYEQFVLPKKINREYPKAIIHYPDSMAPIFSKNKVVITIHDISFRALNNAFTMKSKVWKSIITKYSIKKAHSIIVDTYFTKGEIIKYYPEIDKRKLKVVYCGFNNFAKDSIDESKIKKSLGAIIKPYILTVSTISPRKNIDGLLRAFNIIKDSVDLNLVIAGKNGWLYENVYKLAEELNLKGRAIFTGGINDEELKLLYKNAALFIYPSFYEGFGLPPLEAMSYGIPCIVSKETSIPEVVGQAGLYVDPLSIKDMAQAIITLQKNSESKEKYIEIGYKQIEKFSWVKCSGEICEIYSELL